MALPNGHRFRVQFGEYFPHGVLAVTPVEKVRDFDQSTRDKLVQEVDKHTGQRVWQLQVLDNDPNARKQEKTVTVRLLAEQQPVLPEASDDGPMLVPVEFDELTVTPYVEDRTKRLTYSLRASGVRAPSQGVTPQTGNGSASSAVSASQASAVKEPGKESGKDTAAKDAA